MNDLHGIIFAYRSNPHLRELTQPRNTCSVPFGGRYRLIDLMLSNMVNAGITDIGMIVHESYQSLLDHVGSGKDWDLSRKHGGLRILPPFSFAEQGGEYHGVLEALSCVSSYLHKIRQDYVILAGGDLVVNLPVADIFRHHLESGADITAVCTRTPTGSEPRDCIYCTIGANGLITDAAVHPNQPDGCECLQVYVLSKSLLLSLVEHSASHGVTSFSRGILQGMAGTLRISPYIFEGYAARTHTVRQYFEKSMDLLDPAVRADLFNPALPIRTKDQSNPSTYYGPGASAVNSLVADGCVIEGEVENSILFRGVHVAKGAKVSNCVLMQGCYVGENSILAYTIGDKNVRVRGNRTLMGHSTYPLAIAKNTEV